MRRILGGFFSFVFSISNLILLSIFVLAALAKFFRPENFWPGALVANFLPVIALFLFIFLLVAGKTKKRLWIFWNFLALAYCIFSMWPAISAENVEDEVGNDLVIYTQNIPRHPEERDAQEAIYESVNLESPHIISVQESGVFSTVKEPGQGRVQKKLRILVDSLGYTAPPATRLDESGRWYNMQQPILTKLKVIDQTESKFVYDEDDYDPLFMTRSVLDWKGREVVIYNVHLRTYGRNKPWYHPEIHWFDWSFWQPFAEQIEEAYSTRSWQLDQILGIVDQETLPFLLVGDFNSSPYGWIYSKLSERFTDVFQKSSRGFGHTYHVGLPLVRIDYVFASSDWIAVSSNLAKENPLVSDHRPLVARVRLKD